MIFNYRAVSQDGQVIEGTFEADSETEVVTMLRSNNSIPLKIEQDIDTEKQIHIFKSKIKKRDLAIFCRQFYTMLDAGLGIVSVLDILANQTENLTLKESIQELHEEVQKGLALSDAMKQQSNIYPELLVNMVEAGEVSGNLDTIMLRMAVHYEKDYKLENKVKSALIYPIALIIVSVGVIIFMLTFVMPTFMEMFEQGGQELPALTQTLISISDFIRSKGYILLIALIAIIFGIRTFKQTENGRDFFDGLKIRIPGVKKMNTKIITARFTRTLSTLMASGISLVQSLQMVGKAIGNSVIEKRIINSVEEIRKGMTLSNAINNIEIFPPMVDSMVKIGEESGSLDEMLAKTADFYDEEVEVSIERMTTVLEPLLIVIMAGIIGFIVVSMALPMFDMYDVIQ